MFSGFDVEFRNDINELRLKANAYDSIFKRDLNDIPCVMHEILTNAEGSVSPVHVVKKCRDYDEREAIKNLGYSIGDIIKIKTYNLDAIGQVTGVDPVHKILTGFIITGESAGRAFELCVRNERFEKVTNVMELLKNVGGIEQ